jgi:hypothetical protein
MVAFGQTGGCQLKYEYKPKPDRGRMFRLRRNAGNASILPRFTLHKTYETYPTADVVDVFDHPMFFTVLTQKVAANRI